MRWLSMSLELQLRNLAAPHAGAVENHQQRAPEQVPAGVDQPCDFLLAQNAGQPPMPSRVGQELAELVALQRAHEQETQRSNVVNNAADRQLALSSSR